MKRTVWNALGLAVSLLLIYIAYLSVRIEQQSFREEARPADVILVLGAAEYRGRPSPVLRARLDHALALYRRGIAPRIMTTGGAGGDPVFTESTVGRSYLISQGVPSEAIIVETEGESTVHTVALAGEMIDFGRCGLLQRLADGFRVIQVAGIQKQGFLENLRVGPEMVQVRSFALGRSSEDPVNFVVLGQQQLGQIGTILSFDAGDEGAGHLKRKSNMDYETAGH